MQSNQTNMNQPRILSQLSKDLKDDRELVKLVLRSVNFHMVDHARPYTQMEIREKFDSWVNDSLKESSEL